jgi:two-component system LytT family sensor kinase
MLSADWTKNIAANKRWIEIAMHILVWSMVLLLPYIVRYTYRIHDEPPIGDMMYMEMATKIPWIILFYLNVFALAPLFFNKRRYVLYGLAIIGIFLVITYINRYLLNNFKVTGVSVGHGITAGATRSFRSQPLPELGKVTGGKFLIMRQRMGFLMAMSFNLAPFALTIAASVLYRIFKDKSRADMLARKKQEENLKTELSFLRSQVSPHFLFNVLNNITALARKKSDELEPTVIKLSSLMRYMLYEANEEKVLLKTELEYLSSYIELQRQRFGDKVAIHVQMDDIKQNTARIEPMLLIPFVENAFKHGTGFIYQPVIDILLSVQDDELVFKVKNKCNKNEAELKDTASGIGLQNVSRRLSLLYGKVHTLEIYKETDLGNNIWFHVSLKLKLHDD